MSRYIDFINSSDFLGIEVEEWYNALSESEKEQAYSEILCNILAADMVPDAPKDETYKKKEKILRILTEIRTSKGGKRKRKKIANENSRLTLEEVGSAFDENIVFGTKGLKKAFGWSQTTALRKVHNEIKEAVVWLSDRQFNVDVDLAQKILQEKVKK